MTRLSDHERGTVTISAEQWDKLVELLTPGYELAKLYKAQMEAQPAKAPDEPKAPDEADGSHWSDKAVT